MNKKSLLKILCYISAAIFIFSGLAKILNIEFVSIYLQNIGTKNPLMLKAVGVVEILAAISLLFASTRFFMLVVLIVVIITAIGTHIGAGDEMWKLILPSTIFVLLSYTAYLDNIVAAEEEEDEIEKTGGLQSHH